MRWAIIAFSVILHIYHIEKIKCTVEIVIIFLILRLNEFHWAGPLKIKVG